MIRASFAALCFGATLLALPQAARAQSTSAAPIDRAAIDQAEARAATKRAATEQNERGSALIGSGSPNDRAMAGFSRPTLNFSTEQGESEVSLAFSFDLESREPEPRTDDNGAQFYRVKRTKLGIVASTPLDEGDDASLLFKGDSLVSGTKAKLSFSQLSNRLGNGAGARSYVEPALQACLADQARAWGRSDEGDPDQIGAFVERVNELATREEPGLSTTRGLGVAMRTIARGANEASIESFVYRNCMPEGAGSRFADSVALVRAYSAFASEYARLFYDERSTLKFWGLDASVGQDDYDYLDRALFETPEVKRTAWEVGAYAGLINWNATFSARARAVYGRTWKLPDEGEACETVGDPPAERCLTGPDGPPEKVETGLISVETRHLFALDDERTIAFAPQVTYRFEDDAVGVEVPVYLAPDEKGELSGGLKFAYTSKGDEFGVGVFIGVPFGGVAGLVGR